MNLGQRFAEMPRVLQWALVAAVLLLGFLAWDDNVRPLADDWNQQANRIELQLARAREAAALEQGINRRRNVIELLGPVEVPGDDEEGREALHGLVVDVARSYRTVTNDSFNLGGGADRLPATVSSRLLGASGGGSQRLARISGDLRFDAEPEDAVAIIAALEARPEIESISLVRMLRKDGRKVGVTITLNAWVIQTPRRLATR